MQRGFGVEIPQTLDELCDPDRMALVVYDMQAGILPQISQSKQLIARVTQVLSAAREAGVRVFFTRHMSLPNEVAGMAQLRTRMAWQKATDVTKVKSSFPPGSPQFQLVPELTPLGGEAAFDKITMSAFVGTPLQLLRPDCGISAFAILGVVMGFCSWASVNHRAQLASLADAVGDSSRAGHRGVARTS